MYPWRNVCCSVFCGPACPRQHDSVGLRARGGTNEGPGNPFPFNKEFSHPRTHSELFSKEQKSCAVCSKFANVPGTNAAAGQEVKVKQTT